MDKIRAYFEQTPELTDEYWALFSSKLENKKIRKKSLLIKAGETENYLSFIDQGIVRLYIPGEIDDITFGFAFQNNFISAYDSFLTQQPCNYCIETLTDTTIWQISYNDLQSIYKESKEGNFVGRLAGEALFLEKARREISFLTQSAKERYLNLFTMQPQLIQQVPLKYIASYIGITPQALSRIRKQIT